MSTDEYTVWETVWTVWEMRDGDLVSTGKNFSTEAEAVAVADGLAYTETRVVSSRRVVDTPLPDHLAVDWDAIETGFHEYAADLTKKELEYDGPGGTSYPPEFADWAVGMKAAREWLAAHDARVRREAAREALDGLIVYAETRAQVATTGRGTDDWNTTAANVAVLRDTHYPEETP